ncbi:MAG: FAD-dependent oxidoreductase [Candidatus Syntropharchaeia archaeon]
MEVLVIGGGVAGIQASLDLAEMGFRVYLVEKEPSIGGRMAQLDKTFPTMDCSICILAPKMIDCARHPNIKLLTYSEVKEIRGSAGNFVVKIVRKPRYVDEEKCTGCGLCAEACRLKDKIPNEFDLGLGKRGAIYIPFPQAVPLKYTIDPERCLYLTKGKCGKSPACVDACPRDVIDFNQKEEIIEVNVGAIIVSTGFDLWDPSGFPEYGYKKYPNVFTAMEYERMINASGPTGGELKRRSDGKTPRRIAWIQCVGSRNPRIDHPYCCSVCCMYSTKEAILVKEHYEDAEVYIFYKDMRAFGKGFNEFIERGKKEYGIKYIHSDAIVEENPDNHNLFVVYDAAGRRERIEVDMVILASALVPRKGARELANILGIEVNEFGFYECADEITNPVQSSVPGIFIAGYCKGPVDIPESVAEGSGAAACAAEVMGEE